MRPLGNRPTVLQRVVSSQGFRPHDCPNCNCGSCISPLKQTRPLSPIGGVSPYYHQVSPRNTQITFNYNNQDPMNSQRKFMATSPNNIYFQRTDTFANRNMQDVMNCSGASSRQDPLRTVRMPMENIRTRSPQVNIRYISPSAKNHQEHSRNTSNYFKRESTSNTKKSKMLKRQNLNNPTNPSRQPHSNPQIQEKQQLPLGYENINRNLPITPIILTNNKYLDFSQSNKKQQKKEQSAQELPRIPSILAKKISQKKKDKQESQSSSNRTQSATPNQFLLVDRDVETFSTVMGRKLLQNLGLAESQDINWEHSGSAITLEQEEKNIALDIIKQLKLNFDYSDNQGIKSPRK